jgi:hypothetical protein
LPNREEIPEKQKGSWCGFNREPNLVDAKFTIHKTLIRPVLLYSSET